MSWYGNHVDSAKKLDQLIDQKPTLDQLLNYPDFIQQLKSYNPKLLQFLTNSNQIINQLIQYLTIPPKESDSDQRKFKIPAISIQMIQTQAMSIVNGFFKQNPKTKTKYLVCLFQLICKPQNKRQNNNSILPLLAGYFLRTNICLLNNKYKETIDTIYQNDFCFNSLLQNSQSLSMMNVLQVYLNLDMTKNVQQIVQRTNLKLKVVDKIFNKIDDLVSIYTNQMKKGQPRQQTLEQFRCSIIIQNLSSVIIEILQKYYLIADGKIMVDKILQGKKVQVLFKLATGNSQVSITLLSIISAILKYYSYSSFNSQQLNNKQMNKKNEQRLENQPFIKKLVQCIPLFIKELGINEKKTTYHMKLIQTINSALSLNSHSIFGCITYHKYFQTIIDILMKNQNQSILQMYIEKTFFIIFKTQKLIFDQYRKFLFCTINVIDLTATRYLQLFKNQDQILESMTFNANGRKRKGYFGYLMRIMRTYSQIHTIDTDIINSIKNKSQLWNKVNRLIIKPFFTLSLKQLGSYEGIPQKPAQLYTVKSIIGLNNVVPSKQQADNNSKLIEQINRQQSMQTLKTLQFQNKMQTQNHLPSVKSSNQAIDDEFFKTPQLKNSSPEKKQSAPELSINQNNKEESNTKQQDKGLQLKKSSFSEYMNSKKIQVDRQIRTKRQNSNDGKLSRGKTRLASPSPKRNKWEKDSSTTQQQKERISLTSTNAPKQQQSITQKKNHLPNIPHHKKGLSVSNQSYEQHNKSMQLEKKEELEDSKKYSKSMVNIDMLKNVKFINRFEPPAKKIYVKMGEDDKAFLDMIGITYT